MKNFIKQFRDQNKLTQSELASKLGADQSQISRWERDKEKIPPWVKKSIECFERRGT